MAIRYFNGEIDERPCIGTRGSYSFSQALMVNPDGSVSRVTYEDYDSGRNYGKPIIDATDEDRDRVRRHNKLGHRPYVDFDEYHDVQPGDRVRIVKGRKYPVGTEFTVEGSYVFKKNHVEVPYVYGEGIKVSAENCEVIAIAGVE